MSNEKGLEDNKELVRRCVQEVWNGGREEVIGELIHPNFRRHHPRNSDFDTYGQDGCTAWVNRVRSALPDLHLAVEHLFAEGDRVVLHLLGTGTQRGPLYGVSASGTALRFTVTGVVRVAEGKIAEGWAIPDELGIRQQLGLVAPLG
ncbi:ester cyclase [Candidatus Thiosymbion oneisti]|uniref:ester cyclase n=1 Tax=Candidatus Thiosymbion oneisti TaxID=589554 RepID=UPI00105DB6B3|nr:ester cyclase [Candidatus Thiosymbion oneisti]